MADETNRPRIDEVFWSQLVKNTSSDEEDAYIPGLSAPGNKRPSRVKGRRTQEVKAKIPVRQPIIESNQISQPEATIMYKGKPKKPTLSKQREATVKFDKQDKLYTRDDSGMSTTFESFAERSIRRLQQASLKDLRPEDKQRVANLIKELARVGEEKEQVVKELYGEREQYERQLITMVQQQEKILQEREEIQEKLFQCQKLLTEYQAQLLNKQERLNTSIHQTREDPSFRERQSRSREPRSLREPANRNKLEKYLANQNGDDESVSDLLLNQEERVKRPYTSMIDKEIAKERSLSRGSRDSNYSRSRSNSGSHGEGRPRFAYPQKLSGIGPLHEPLAHSTQKSMEIRAHNNDNESLRSRTSVQGKDTKVKGQMNKTNHVESEQVQANSDVRNKVAFNDKEEYNVGAEMHSPIIKPPTQLFSDPDYAQYYKKLSPGGRKRELLKQRQALLDEQERLRKVLEKQEKQLQNRKYEYEKRKELQEQRMQFYKEGGKFPPLKLDFEAGSEKEAGFSEAEDEGADKVLIVRDDGSQVEMYSPHNDIQIDDEIHVKSRVSMGTSPMATPPRGNKDTMASSPATSQGSREDIPHLIDVATSISYRTPLKDSSNKQQGNLALGCNRQRMKELHMPSPRSEHLPSVHTPGEKTLNVLELVNSLQEDDAASSYHNRLHDDIENRPSRQYTPNKYITQGRQYTPDKYITQAKGSQSSQYRQYNSLAQRGTSRGKLLDDQEESIEETKILEDIFFL